MAGRSDAQQSHLFRLVDSITKYVAAEEFSSMPVSDLQKTDSIYCHAVRVAEGNLSDALLGLTIALVAHTKIPVTLPLLGLRMDFHFLSSTPETVNKKNDNLPKVLFLDSPHTMHGDQDKLAHFFGSAFLSYNMRLFDYSLVIGYFVESFEETFGISRIDDRDMRANSLGVKFGKMIREKEVMPSQIFLMYNLKYFII
ncbi:MAG: hypothetical protein GX452_04515 [Ignavibacteriales bacterium]|jgi:hypothetical protein|nr:hypothetical protein [Ignavibacteriaceae bacterium]NLH60647.1 hypothetical protein [Ignavibacteriales bacterium]HOJ18400.1 hypothetical protein [Ignavibacteriaceae bacterium]HPO56955.1 hypothetical protein [Ignavibacteriaceae bacterium]